MLGTLYSILSSVKLAIALLIIILLCCITGVTVIRGEDAWRLIFNTLWFNALLVGIVINVASCFFVRIWKKRLTLITTGMIMFHLSFVMIFIGVIYNNLFYFRGLMRLTEGETLRNDRFESFDYSFRGRFFDINRFSGETTLIRMHRGYMVDNKDKRIGYEIEVGEGSLKKHDIIYVTHSLEFKDFRYFTDREGYSVLVILHDKFGRELYGAHIPLQSLPQGEGMFFYTTGSRHGPGTLPFPYLPREPMFNLQVIYNSSKFQERTGEVIFRLFPLKGDSKKPFAEGKSEVGKGVKIGDYILEAREIRYWVGMEIRYDPGKPYVLTSLWIGFAGIVLTFIGRLIKRQKSHHNNK